MAAAIYKAAACLVKRVPSLTTRPNPNPVESPSALSAVLHSAAAGHGARPELVDAVPRHGAPRRGRRRRGRVVGGGQGARRRRQLDGGGAARGRGEAGRPARVALPAPRVRERPRPDAADGVRTHSPPSLAALLLYLPPPPPAARGAITAVAAAPPLRSRLRFFVCLFVCCRAIVVAWAVVPCPPS